MAGKCWPCGNSVQWAPGGAGTSLRTVASARNTAKPWRGSPEFTVVDAPELVAALRALTGRYQRAIDASQAGRRSPRLLRRLSAENSGTIVR